MADASFREHPADGGQIVAAFGVAHQLNDLDRATHTNVEHQQRVLCRYAMDILTGYEQELTYKLFTDKNWKPDIILSLTSMPSCEPT